MIILDAPAVAVTIAGVDPTGGAGIAMDLRAFSAAGVHGGCVVSALTDQDTRSFRASTTADPSWVKAQLKAVLADLPVGAVKTGMLGSAAVIDAVLECLADHDAMLVVDPVLQSSTGGTLTQPDAEEALQRLMKRAAVVTPNSDEATLLARGASLEQWQRQLGVPVLVTGGHGSGKVVVDTLLGVDDQPVVWRNPRRSGGPYHGTGCALSAAIAARLARGESLQDACQQSIEWLQDRIATAWHPGEGQALLG